MAARSKEEPSAGLGQVVHAARPTWPSRCSPCGLCGRDYLQLVIAHSCTRERASAAPKLRRSCRSWPSRSMPLATSCPAQ